jgi:hypothetical protein
MIKLTTDLIFSVRGNPKIRLPVKIQEMISKLRLNPAPYKPKPSYAKSHRPSGSSSANWRDVKILEIKKIAKNDDKDYSAIVEIINKVAPSNVTKLSADAIAIIQNRDEDFRLSISVLLFNKAITQPDYTTVMAKFACEINNAISEVSDDFVAQVAMFSKLYDMEQTILFPSKDSPDFDDKVVAWTKQKEKKRGFAKFIMELFENGVIPEDSVLAVLKEVILEINETAQQPQTNQTVENVKLFSVFLFESSKILKGTIKDYLKESITGLIGLPKEQVPSLNMFSRIKLENALKELNKEE